VAASIFSFVLASLATWRVTHLLANEDGPFNLIFYFRRWLGKSFLGHLLDCFYCLSIWIALPFGLWLSSNWKEYLLLWLALSGAACLLEKSTTKSDAPKPPDYFED
jgi:uncharacterized membrane protein